MAQETYSGRRLRLARVFADTMKMIEENAVLSEAVKSSQSRTKFYAAGLLDVPHSGGSRSMKVSVTANRSFQAARELVARNPGKRVAVLNFASATNPGGGVVDGSSAQEESLCRCSTLYPALDCKWLREKYYSFHWNRHDRLYTDACIYTPDVKIIKSDVDNPERLPQDEWVNVDVITCAAPNLRHMAAGEVPSPSELERLHLERGRKILNVALENGVDCLVLGAFGCGAFRNDPQVVAGAYADLMAEYGGAFDEIEYAVFYWGDEVTNYKTFKNALDSGK